MEASSVSKLHNQPTYARYRPQIPTTDPFFFPAKLFYGLTLGCGDKKIGEYYRGIYYGSYMSSYGGLRQPSRAAQGRLEPSSRAPRPPLLGPSGVIWVRSGSFRRAFGAPRCLRSSTGRSAPPVDWLLAGVRPLAVAA